MFSSRLPIRLTLLIGCVIVLVAGSVNVSSGQTLERARTLESAGDYGSAFLEYREQFRNAPALAPAALGMLRNGIRLERWNAARRALDNYEQLQPGTDTAAILGARLYYQQNQLDTALQWANRARERDSGSWLPYYLTAQIQFDRANYVEALNNARSARLRNENQWILLLELLTNYQLEGAYEQQTLDRLRSVADHPQVFWELAEFDGIDWTRSEAAGLLGESVDSFPVSPPPLRASVSEADYRFRLAKLEYRLGNRGASRAVIDDYNANRSEIQWLKAVLTPDTTDRLSAQQTVLRRVPDRLVYRWAHSLLAREVEGLNGPNRNETSDFFNEEFRNNRLFGYPESALAALIRSLELQPTHAERQFQLARYYHNRGWKQSELSVVNRVRELGLDEPSRITDYIEGLNVDTDPVRPTIPRGDVLIDVSLNTLWEGPVEGRDVLESMIAHSLFHQPAFNPIRSGENTTDSPVTLRMDDEGAEAALQLDINRWGEVIEASMTLHLPDNEIRQIDFYARGRMKPWRLLNNVVTSLKSEWPWEGTLYREEEDGAWVNLGRVHGVTEGDTFQVNENRFGAETVLENRTKLRYPTPVFQGKVNRGSTAELLSDTEATAE